MMKQIRGLIKDAVHGYRKIDLDKIDGFNEEKGIFKDILNGNEDIVTYSKSLQAVSTLLTQYYQKETIILIDEYDTPILTSWLENFYDDMIDFFRGFLGAGLKDNDINIKKVLVTGIFRISGESMFSGLNNLKYITILDNKLSSSCGFTINESKKLLSDYNFDKDTVNRAIDWYDGYTIGNDIILNPWSMLNFTDTRKFDTYWINTASNDFIYDLLDQSQSLKDEFEKLLINEPIDIKVEKNLTFKDKTI